MTTTAPAKPVRTNSDITAEIREIASAALDASGGRTSHDYTTGTEKPESGTGVIGVSAKQIRDHLDDDPIAQAKLKILWLLLHPDLNLVGRTARSNPAVSDYMHERLRVRLEEILEQKVLQNPPTGLDLEMLVHETPKRTKAGTPVTDGSGDPVMRKVADPVGWARQLLFGSLAVTTLRVFKNEKAQLTGFADADTGTDGHTSTPVYRRVLEVELPFSAEDQYLIESEEADRIDEDPESALERWREDSEGKRGIERSKVAALTVIAAFGLREAAAPAANADRRALLADIVADRSLPLESLRAFRSLSLGNPTPDQLVVSDGMLALWRDYSPEQTARLLEMDDRVPGILAEAALALPSRPGRDSLRKTRNTLRLASNRTGWHDVVRRALDSWTADHFSARSDFDYRSDADPVAVEALASDWADAAGAVLAWPGHPAGAGAKTVGDVHDWISAVLAAG